MIFSTEWKVEYISTIDQIIFNIPIVTNGGKRISSCDQFGATFSKIKHTGLVRLDMPKSFVNVGEKVHYILQTKEHPTFFVYLFLTIDI